jgi:hypothetical protein
MPLNLHDLIRDVSLDQLYKWQEIIDSHHYWIKTVSIVQLRNLINILRPSALSIYNIAPETFIILDLKYHSYFHMNKLNLSNSNN